MNKGKIEFGSCPNCERLKEEKEQSRQKFLTLRKGTIELRYLQNSPEFVQWYPNYYFGKKEKYLSEGWHEADGFVGKDRTFIHKDLFSNPESCIVIAWLKSDNEGFYLESVGSRLLDLSPTDLADFWEVYRKANEGEKQ